MSLVAKFKKRFYFVAASYFRFFANFAFRRWHPRVIAITGSAGKTTMLHLIEHQLGASAHYSHNANSAFGIAFDLVGLRGVNGSKLRWLWLIIAVPLRSLYFTRRPRYYVVEIDGERPREAEFLASWLRPEVTLWVSIGLSHAAQFQSQLYSGEFDSLESAITHEFAAIPRHTRRQIYIDGDSSAMQNAVKGLSATISPVHRHSIEKYSVKLSGTDFATVSGVKFHFNHPEPRDISIQLLMLEQLMQYLKKPLIADFSDIVMPAGRSSIFAGKVGDKSLHLIDSSYNAHLISMKTILGMARDLKVSPKWLVIGDIVDQGLIEAEEHTRLAELIAAVNPDQVILIGSRTRKYTLPLLKSTNIPVEACSDARLALKFIKRTVGGGETLIFKGSQYLEWIIEQLLADPADASRLPRRESAAIRRRKKRGLN